MPEPRGSARIWLITGIMAAFIVYGSLYPFEFSIPTNRRGAVAAFLASWDARAGRGDFLANILLYVPFGGFLLLGLRRDFLSMVLAVLAGALLSLSMELTQYYDVGRDTEATDFYANIIGTLLGALAVFVMGARSGVPLAGSLPVRPAMLVVAWLGYRLYPYVPTINPHKYWDALKPTVLAPSLSGYDLFRQTAIWLTLCALIHAVVRGRHTIRLMLLFAAAVFGARLVIISNEIRLAEPAGFAFAFGLWLLLLSLPARVRSAIVGLVLCTYVIALRLEPFEFQMVGRPFGWIPFHGFMYGSVVVDTLAFLEKLFLYGAMLYFLGWASGGRALLTTVFVAAVLFCTSWLETFLPGRSAEITDAMMVLIVALIFALLPSDTSDVPARWRRVRGSDIECGGAGVGWHGKKFVRRIIRLRGHGTMSWRMSDREPRRGPSGTRWRLLLWFIAAGCGLGIVVAAACVVPLINLLGIAPARMADRIMSLPEGRGGTSRTVTEAIAGTLQRLGITHWLRTANAIEPPADLPFPAWAGASEAHNRPIPPGRIRRVTTSEMLRQAIESADPGDVIVLQPGVYAVRGNYLTFQRPGTQAAPITLTAERPGSVTIQSELSEAMKVQAPHWRFENLVLRGVCGDDSRCDNGFHITGAAADTVIRDLRIEDFNAQIKINGEDGQFPDNGRIEHTTLIDTHPRNTDSPVTPIDLVAANGWLIQDNLIADFVKLGGDKVSYGAFAKGEARGTVFTRNTVLCEWHLRGAKGQTIGLSFGGGGTGQEFRRDLGRSGYEHADGVMSDNLIAFCSDDGIYLNRSANGIVRHNTLIGTFGVDVRYPESTALLEANLVDGPVRARNGGMIQATDNQTGSLPGMFLGRNSVRAFFVAPARLDLRWRQAPESAKPDTGVDACGVPWQAPAPAGAFMDFAACGGAKNPPHEQ